MLLASGRVLSWGQNDDAALGRRGEENAPGFVDGFGLPESGGHTALPRVRKVSAGDSHSCALTEDGQLYALFFCRLFILRRVMVADTLCSQLLQIFLGHLP